jgi:hypothetical protein
MWQPITQPGFKALYIYQCIGGATTQHVRNLYTKVTNLPGAKIHLCPVDTMGQCWSPRQYVEAIREFEKLFP